MLRLIVKKDVVCVKMWMTAGCSVPRRAGAVTEAAGPYGREDQEDPCLLILKGVQSCPEGCTLRGTVDQTVRFTPLRTYFAWLVINQDGGFSAVRLLLAAGWMRAIESTSG